MDTGLQRQGLINTLVWFKGTPPHLSGSSPYNIGSVFAVFEARCKLPSFSLSEDYPRASLREASSSVDHHGRHFMFHTLFVVSAHI